LISISYAQWWPTPLENTSQGPRAMTYFWK
jgi:hypothetical protein